MIKYSIMSPSGKIGVDWYNDYEQALLVYNEMKDLWKEPYRSQSYHIIYYYQLDNIIKEGSLTDEEFLNDCKPKLFYRIGYKGEGSYIGSQIDLEMEREFAVQNDMLNDLIEKPIYMSIFTWKLLQEFKVC